MLSAMPRPMGGSLKPTTDALKSATERILKEQQAALQAKEIYSQKLTLAQDYTKRLETAYEQLISNNSSLRLKVSSDDRAVRELICIVEAQKHDLASTLGRVAGLTDRLSATESERAELVASRDASETAGAKLADSLKQVSEEAETLRSKLRQAVQKCAELEERIQKAEDAQAAQKKAAEAHAESLFSNLESTKRDLAAQTSLAASRETELTDAESKHVAALAQLQQQLQTSQSTSNTLSEKLSTKEEALSQLETNLAVAKSLNEKLAAEAEEIAKRVESLQGELASVNEEHTALKDDHATLQQTLQQEKEAAALHQEAAEDQHAAEKEAADAALKQVRDEAEAAAAAAVTALEDAKMEAQEELERATKRVKESGDQALAAARELASAALIKIKEDHEVEVRALAAQRQKLVTELAAGADLQTASEKEKAALEHRLDETGEARRQAEAKVSQTSAELLQTQQYLEDKTAEAEGYANDIIKLQDDLAEVKAELDQKKSLLQGISAVAGGAGAGGAVPPGSAVNQQPGSTLKQPSDSKPASSTKRRAGASPAGTAPRSARQRVRFEDEPTVIRTLDHALNGALPDTEPQDEEDEEQDFADFGGGGGDNGDWGGYPETQDEEELHAEEKEDEGEEEDRSMAMVPVSRARSSQAAGAAAVAAHRRQLQKKQQSVRQVREPTRPVVEEPDSESDSDGEADDEGSAGYRQARGKATYHRKPQPRASQRGVAKVPSHKAASRRLVALHQPTKNHGANDNGKRAPNAVRGGSVAKAVGRKEGGKHGLFGLFNGLSHASPDGFTP